MITLPAILFQSTLPIREETLPSDAPVDAGPLISIHSSHTGRDTNVETAQRRTVYFNPLFPYGKRQRGARAVALDMAFQSTLPIREETKEVDRLIDALDISIHSSHTGRDGHKQQQRPALHNFNPLFPYGKRPVSNPSSIMLMLISIHSSHTGRDRTDDSDGWKTGIFQSTLPIREETRWNGA